MIKKADIKFCETVIAQDLAAKVFFERVEQILDQRSTKNQLTFNMPDFYKYKLFDVAFTPNCKHSKKLDLALQEAGYTVEYKNKYPFMDCRTPEFLINITWNQ